MNRITLAGGRSTQVVFLVIVTASLLFAPTSIAGTYWISNNGTASWSNCGGATPLAGVVACSLSTANANATAGDTVYLRGGTYTITGTGIAPKNSGTAQDNMITFSGYGSETPTIYGENAVAGAASRAVFLYGKSYIKITKIIFTNLSRYLWIVNGSHHIEISYCTFTGGRDVWNVDVVKTGTHTGTTGSSTVLEDASLSGGTNTYAYKRIENVTDGSSAYMANSSDATKVTHTTWPLRGGNKNYWSTGDQYKITYTIDWGGSYIYEGNAPKAAVSHIWIHHNTFSNYGAYTKDHDEGVVLEIGVGLGATYNNDYITVEDNHMYAGGHHVFGMNASRYSVIRNNYFHNEGWFRGGGCSNKENGVCGYRVVYGTVQSIDFGGHSLWEGNRIGHGAAYGGPHEIEEGGSGSGTTLATPSNIYRYNDHFNNALYGLRLGASISAAGNNNRVYNNTFYHNGYNSDDDNYAYDNSRGGISLYNEKCVGISGTVIKNNLLYKNWSTENTRMIKSYYFADIYAVSAENLTCNTIMNNYNASANYLSSTSPSSGVNPLFNDPDITRPLSTTKPDLSLQSGSPAIDKGTYLTLAKGSGANSNRLVVDDATYFQDGTWGSDLARATLYADWISIGSFGNSVQISSINYDTNTITLTSPLTWQDKAPIWLAKNSVGARVRYGAAPDMGAHEFEVEYIMPPQNLRFPETK